MNSMNSGCHMEEGAGGLRGEEGKGKGCGGRGCWSGQDGGRAGGGRGEAGNRAWKTVRSKPRKGKGKQPLRDLWTEAVVVGRNPPDGGEGGP
jgi:hypothetical protein